MKPRVPTRAVYRAIEGLTASKLRVLAYHGVPDTEAFGRQLEVIARDWHAVSAAEVLSALRRESTLPDRAVWLTFDDGLRSTIVDSLPVLDTFAIKATAFVNPGVIEGSGVQWWEVVSAAMGEEQVRLLKRCSDDRRREAIASLASDRSSVVEPTTASESELRRWIASGHAVGNHTWDHPVLDRCDPLVQIEQIRRADDWLRASGLMVDRVFAYPNGDWTPEASHYLDELGYQAALLFDHRLGRTDKGPTISRLRIDASASLERFRAILSGAHSGGFSVARRLGVRT